VKFDREYRKSFEVPFDLDEHTLPKKKINSENIHCTFPTERITEASQKPRIHDRFDYRVAIIQAIILIEREYHDVSNDNNSTKQACLAEVITQK
jgi:hypothetical protein